MMKTLCVAVFVLSLTSVCQPASLACDKLLKPVDKSPVLTGRWYLIAMSADVCLIPAIFHSFVWPSIAVDVTAQATPKVHQSNYKVRIYGYCTFNNETFLSENNVMSDLDENNVPTGEKDVLLYTGCPDCLVAKGNDSIEFILLFSRRNTVTAAELKEFEAQAECLDWSKPQTLNTDHDYENCKSLDVVEYGDADASELLKMMYQRLKTTYEVFLQCTAETIIHGVRGWVKEQLNSLW